MVGPLVSVRPFFAYGWVVVTKGRHRNTSAARTGKHAQRTKLTTL